MFTNLAPPQEATTENLRLAGLKVSGLNLISEKQAAAGTGLRVGDPVAISDLSSVADKMAKSGVFERVAFQYATRGDELTAVFTVVENKPLLPCLFDNFVWFPGDDVDEALRARVPFYSGAVPMTGAMQEEVQDTLRGLLKSSGFSADIQVLPSPGPGEGGKVMLFRAVGISMPVRTLNFPGAAAVSEKDVEVAAAAEIGQDFSITNMTDFTRAVLLPFYRERGYLRASFDLPQWAIIGAPAPGSPADIAVTLPVKEGGQYSRDKAAWSGNQQLSVEQLDGVLGMKHGDVANQTKIE